MQIDIAISAESFIKQTLELLKSKIARDSVIVLSGNVISAGLGFFATVLITRTLGPAQFGLFSVALAVMMATSQFSDFGISTGLVRFSSLYLQTDKLKANLMFKVSLKIRLIIAPIIFLIGFLVSGALANQVFGKPDLIFPLKLAFIGALGASLAGYMSATLQARQSFMKFTLINLINPVVKVTVIGLLFLALKLNLLSALTTVVIIPFIAFLIGSLIIPKDFLKAKGDESECFRELLNFCKWIVISAICCILFTRLDVLMLTYFKAIEDVGFYSAAFVLASAFRMLSFSVITVLLPEVSKMTKKEQYKTYIKKASKVTIPLAICFVPILIVAKPFILFVYGREYINSVIIFQILMLPFLAGLIVRPINAIMYSLNKTNILAYLNILQLIFNFSLNLLLIPPYGAIGAAITTAGSSVIAWTVILSFLYFKIYRG